MGWIKDTKAQLVATDAQRAWDEGAWVFTPILNMPSSHPGNSGRVADWEQMMQAVMQVGWQLHTWAVCSDAKGRPQAQPLFVRPQG